MIYIKENRSYTDNPTEGAVSLLEHKLRYLESRRNPNGIPTEEKGTERNRIEGNRVEGEDGGFQPGEDYSTEFSSPEDIAAAAADRKLKILHGDLGKGVVFLSDAQIGDLLDRMDLEPFDYYVDKLANFIIRSGAKVKNHYETILKWWNEDSEIQK